MPGTLEIPRRRSRQQAHVVGAILRDVQFWIPVVVLAGGLIVLGWIR